MTTTPWQRKDSNWMRDVQVKTYYLADLFATTLQVTVEHADRQHRVGGGDVHLDRSGTAVRVHRVAL